METDNALVCLRNVCFTVCSGSVMWLRSVCGLVESEITLQNLESVEIKWEVEKKGRRRKS